MSRNVKRDGLSNSNGDSVENSAEKMPEEKPKRASRKKSEKAAQGNSPEGIAVKAEEDKPKRTRKKKGEPEETPAVEPAEAKPKKTRKTKGESTGDLTKEKPEKTPQELTSKEPIETTQGVPTSEGTTQQPPSEEPTPEEPKRVLKKSRVWEIQSYIKDVDGNEIFTPEKIRTYLKKLENHIERWCWVIHDRDKFTVADLEKAEEDGRVLTSAIGEPKPAHIHLVVEYYNPVYSSAVAKDIGLPERQVQKAKAKRNQFVAIAAYFTHEDEKQQQYGKARYYDSDIYCSRNFDYRKEVDNYFAHRKMFNSATMPRARVYELIEGVANGDLSFRDIKQRYGFAFFLEYEQKFLKAYREYIKMTYEMQPRINIFIEGPAGRGKSSLAVEVAKALYPKPDESAEVNENDMYYVAGKRGVRFDDYGYQPTIIWDDVRSAELLSEFGREGILNLFEIYPKKANYNIKFGGTILVNQVNIFTGIEDYRTFLDGLMKGYKDKSGKTHDAEEGEKKFQSYRRMAMVLSVHQDFFEIKLNKALFSNGKPNEFETYARVGLDIYSLNRHFTGDAKKRMLEDALKPVKEKVDEYRHLNQTEYKITGKEINAQPIEIITDKDELKELEEKDRERYASYAKAYAEMEKKSKGDKADTEEDLSEEVNFEKWRMKGCPELPDENGPVVDSYSHGVDMDLLIDEWYSNTDKYGDEEEVNDFYSYYLSIEDGQEAEAFAVTIEFLYGRHEILNRVYEDITNLRENLQAQKLERAKDNSFLSDETADAEKQLKEKEQDAKKIIAKCAAYIRDKFELYKKQIVVQKIAKIGEELGVITSIDELKSLGF